MNDFVLSDQEANDVEAVRNKLHAEIERLQPNGEFAGPTIESLRRQRALLGRLITEERASRDEYEAPRLNIQESGRSIEVALTSSAHFLESLLAECSPGQWLRLEAALEGVQRAVSYVGGAKPRWRTDDPPHGLRCLVTHVLPTHSMPLIEIAVFNVDRKWRSGTALLPRVLAWTPCPEAYAP